MSWTEKTVRKVAREMAENWARPLVNREVFIDEIAGMKASMGALIFSYLQNMRGLKYPNDRRGFTELMVTLARREL